MAGLHVVWFRRDLRVHDHAALRAAAASGAGVVPLYIFEPSFWAAPESSTRQFDFLVECLGELDAALQKRGTKLIVRVGEAQEVLAGLHRAYGLAAVHRHADPGACRFPERDQALQRWLMQAGIGLREPLAPALAAAPLPPGERTADRWRSAMQMARVKAPDTLAACTLPAEPMPIAADLGLSGPACPGRQSGGRQSGASLLRSFISARGRRYRKEMSSPLTAAEACSRLSPHLAFGTVSAREAWQAAERARLAYIEDGDATFAASLDSFQSRLCWRSDMTFKLPAASWATADKSRAAYDGQRPIAAPDDPRLAAWISGRTGFPFVDACMRSLIATGWLNFRMRAMLIGFAAHHLWLDWQVPAEMLGALFTDFDAAIHYTQCHMQGHVNGSEIPRIYNPVKQSRDQDPDGVFIREWVPELGGLDAPHIHAPWEASTAELARAGLILGQAYPMRIVDHVASGREARERMFASRRPLAADLSLGHAPRPRVTRSTLRAVRLTKALPRPAPCASSQLSLDLGVAH
jgi:deoxyribodipyrimidine photo-lyase